MPPISDSVDLARLALPPGGGRRLDLELAPSALEYGGQTYGPASQQIPVRLEVSRTAAGHAMRLRFRAQMHGPCVRCLAEAANAVEVDSREVSQSGTEDEELTSPYVVDDELDLASWARDALALAMPDLFLCREDCAGLCQVCGASLNDLAGEEHRHDPEPDPRWAKLRELQGD